MTDRAWIVQLGAGILDRELGFLQLSDRRNSIPNSMNSETPSFWLNTHGWLEVLKAPYCNHSQIFIFHSKTPVEQPRTIVITFSPVFTAS